MKIKFFVMKIVLLFCTIDQFLYLDIRSTLQCSSLHFINYIPLSQFIDWCNSICVQFNQYTLLPLFAYIYSRKYQYC
jgi:hypothetical protein